MKDLMTRISLVVLFAFLGAGAVLAQGTVSGTVIDSETGEGLEGATVLLQGTSRGAFTDYEGGFEFSAPEGSYTLEVRYIGYQSFEKEIKVSGDVNLGALNLVNNAIGVDGVEILASLAVDRKTPVAVSSIDSRTIDEKLSNKEFPQILQSTPSVYTTRSGGGFGDARINVRGFDQRNTAVLINGIPVNDMENGWVYWSNWAGLADVTRTIQIQRGLGASKLAINSVGGTINIVTKATDMQAGATARYAVGNDGYQKFGGTVSTGRLDNGLAITVSGSRTVGNGYIDATWIDAYNYFASVAKDFGDKHQVVFTAIGAPQRHGQRTFRENVTTYVPYADTTQSYADYIGGLTTSDVDQRNQGNGFQYSSRGNIRYNSDWGFRGGDIYNIRTNFYHKPQLALNHYWTINEDFSLKTSAYYSIGRGGGTGDRGSIGGLGTWGYRDDNGIIMVDRIMAWNQGADNLEGFPAAGNTVVPASGLPGDNAGFVATERNGLIKRASMNEHNWLGVLSTANVALSEKIDLTAGIDVRRYVGLHYRRVEDLMGADYWLDSRDVNQQDVRIDANGDGTIDSREEGKLTDHTGRVTSQSQKIHYDNDGVVGWQGAFTQVEVSPTEDFNFFVAASGSNTSYKRIDRFNYLEGSTSTDTTFGETSQTFNFLGYNAKAGANYNLNNYHNVYFNTGYYSRAPIFDAVFPFFTNEPSRDINNDLTPNEKTFAVELGYGLRTEMVSANVNLYRTNWIDKTFFRRYTSTTTGLDFSANLSGLNAVHQGIEIDGAIKPVNGLTIRAMLSLGDWQWTNDVEAIISDDNDVVVDTVNIYSAGLKVGDAAQTTASIGFDYELPFGLKLFATGNYAGDLYAQFDPEDRDNPDNSGVQAYELPSFFIIDAGAAYNLTLDKLDITFNANVNNLFDELYIQEANDNPSATGLDQLNGFFGFGRTWSLGVVFRYR